MPEVRVGPHLIEIETSIWGSAKIRYDGRLVASGSSIFGRTYVFQEKEVGEWINYEVDFRSGLISSHVTVRRNGIAIFAS